MPTIRVDKSVLFEHIGKEYEEEEFEQIAFNFGIELDGIIVEKDKKTEKEKKVYKLEVAANRHDLLSVEGIGTALGVYTGNRSIPNYKREESSVIVHATNKNRPFILCAVLEDISITPSVYESMIDMQEKIHDGIGRSRKLVSMGIHDLDKIKSPFYYKQLSPDQIKFKPLNEEKEITCNEMKDFFKKKKIGKYLPLLEEMEEYPVLLDREGSILSVPPIINGDLSAVTTKTKNLFIEVTALDENRACVALDSFLTSFSKYCKVSGKCLSVSIKKEQETSITPSFEWRTKEITLEYLSSRIGVDLDFLSTISSLLQRMCLSLLSSEKINGKTRLNIMIPPNRRDILHPCDIMEDVAIAYGFDLIKKKIPSFFSEGKQLLTERIRRKLREELAFCGFVEVLPYTLCSLIENSACEENRYKEKTVTLLNPRTEEFQVVATSLLVGILKTISKNIKEIKPIKLFSVSDVVHIDDKQVSGAINKRRVCVSYCGNTSGFEIIHGLVDRIFSFFFSGEKVKHSIKEGNEKRYLKGRQADVFLDEEHIGSFGTLNPDVLDIFRITHPVSVLEIELSSISKRFNK